ncbi:MAG TPA: CRISPR-associated endonuclease Cas1 [Methylothermaceae bacterium]|nr:CRISPR-associated endonuclease Cas1 [Methylothermaceae bacterium]
MSTFYVDRKGSELSMESGVLVVRAGNARQTIPVALLDRLVIAAKTRLDTSLLNRLAEAGVSVILLDCHRSRRRAQLLGSGHNDASVRIAQYHVSLDPELCLAWTRPLVAAKLLRHRRMLKGLHDVRREWKKFLDAAVGFLQELETKALNAEDLVQLRGYEGSAGRCFFDVYHKLFPTSLQFTGRLRRPPPDPVNATLSLAYSLLHARAVQSAWSAGLDPMIGFYHQIAWGRESLACDLIEPWRPCIDHWVYEWFRDRWLEAKHFSMNGENCRLSKAGRERFFGAFELRMRPVHRALRFQIRVLAQTLRKEVFPLCNRSI